MSYDVFNKKEPLVTTYPELLIVIKSIDATELKVDLDKILRHVVWFYTRDQNAYIERPNYEKRFEFSFNQFDIPLTNMKNKKFEEIENVMAQRYMFMTGDTDIEVYLSIKKKMSSICAHMRQDEDNDWQDETAALNSMDKTMEMREKISIMEQKIFGDHEKIKKSFLSTGIKQIVAENYIREERKES